MNPKPEICLFLVGMMGSGKSYWAKQLSKNMDLTGYDLDELIMSSEGLSIAEIFVVKGEVYFRKAEAAILRKFADNNKYILSTGGGTPCFENNMDWMNRHGTTIWIDEPIELLAERLQAEKAHRPLIHHLNDSQLIDFLQKKMAERVSFYQQADYHLTTGNFSIETFLSIVSGKQ